MFLFIRSDNMKQDHPILVRSAIVGVLAMVLAGLGVLVVSRPPAPEPAPARVVPKAPPARPLSRTLTPASPPAVKPAAAAPAVRPLPDLAQRVQPKGAVPHEAVLTFKTGAAMAEFLKRAAREGLIVKGRLDSLRSVRVAYDSLDNLQRELSDYGADYAGVGANFPVLIPGVPPQGNRVEGGDAPFGNATLSAIGAGPEVNRSEWGRGVTVAVLDSGVVSHPTFFEGQVTHVDLVNDGQPFDGHGTAIASLIVGSLDGAQGVAPAANILDVRIAGAGGSDSFQLARGIQTAVERGAQIINVSMGSYGDSPVVAEAVKSALEHGVIVVASVGNDSAAVKNWPAAYPGVISVSGVDANGQLAYYSNSGQPTLAAPGVGIPSAFAQANKAYLAVGDGTSQAAALVSGAAAAILSQGGNVLLTLSGSALSIPANKQQAGAGMLHISTGSR